MALLIFTFVIILILVLVVAVIFMRPTRSAKALQLRLIDIRQPYRSITEDQNQLEFEEAEEPSLSGKIGAYLQRYPISSKLRVLFLQTRSQMTLGTFTLFSVGTAALLCTACAVFFGRPALEMVAFLVGLTLPYLWLRRVRSKLLDAFGQLLPDAIDLMARALRAGHSIQQAIELIAEQSPEPLASEFAQVHQEQKFGLLFRDALLQMSERVPSKDLHFFVTAILVQKETGSDLIEILDRTTAVIRDRVRVAGEIKTYTAQGRLTGWILSLLPFVLLAVISFASPGYAAPLFEDPVGQKLLAAGCVMIIVGFLIIRKIVAVEV